MKIILFEDNQINNLNPITLTRPGFDIMCGGVTLYQLVKKIFPEAKIDFNVRDHLEKITEEKFGRYEADDDEILFINSSLVPSFKILNEIKEKISQKKEIILELKSAKVVLAAYLKVGEDFNTRKTQEFLSKQILEPEVFDWPYFEHPWQVIVFNQKIIKNNLDELKTDFKEYEPGIFIGKDVEIAKQVVFDVSDGSVIINDETKILPFSYLAGPIYIGKKCKINEHSSIKDNCSIGDVCKIGGEVEASVIQGYSNKQHYGFLGHSYIGEWVNLGAGTSNSDLKNTYSNIKVNGVDTLEQFLGCVIGDYSKTAINSSIYTGKIIGVNSFIYGMVADDVPSFTNYARSLGFVTEFLLEAGIKSQKAVMARRGLEQQDHHIQLLRDVFEMTKDERKDLDIKACPIQLNKLKKWDTNRTD